MFSDFEFDVRSRGYKTFRFVNKEYEVFHWHIKNEYEYPYEYQPDCSDCIDSIGQNFDNQATHYCPECEEYMCPYCTSSHEHGRKRKKSRHAKLVPLGAAKDMGIMVKFKREGENSADEDLIDEDSGDAPAGDSPAGDAPAGDACDNAAADEAGTEGTAPSANCQFVINMLTSMFGQPGQPLPYQNVPPLLKSLHVHKLAGCCGLHVDVCRCTPCDPFCGRRGCGR